jgi:hypothetical protein
MHADHALDVCRDCKRACRLTTWRRRIPRVFMSEQVDCFAGNLLPRRQQSASAERETSQPFEEFQMGVKGLQYICEQAVHKQESWAT